MQDFKRLDSWRKAHALYLNVQSAISCMPKSAHSSLKSQMLRAADSIPTNIVEGAAASSRKEFARFLDNSIKSTSELEYHLIKARDCRILPGPKWSSLTNDTVQVRKMVYSLRRRIREADARKADDPPSAQQEEGRALPPSK